MVNNEQLDKEESIAAMHMKIYRDYRGTTARNRRYIIVRSGLAMQPHNADVCGYGATVQQAIIDFLGEMGCM